MPTASSIARTRAQAGLASLAVAPVIVTVGFAISPDDTSKTSLELSRWADHRSLYLFGALLAAAGLALMVPASVTLLRLFRQRCALAGWISCTLLAIGAIALAAGSMMVGVVMTLGTGSGMDRATAVSFVHAAENEAVGGVPWFVGVLMFAGFLGVAISTLVARSAPWWQPSLLIVGGALVFLSGTGILSVVMAIPLMAAFASLAWTIYRRESESTTIDVTDKVPAQSTSSDAAERTRA